MPCARVPSSLAFAGSPASSVWPPVGCLERPSAPCPPGNVPIEPAEPTARLPRTGSVQPDDYATSHTRLGPRTVARAVSQSPPDYVVRSVMWREAGRPARRTARMPRSSPHNVVRPGLTTQRGRPSDLGPGVRRTSRRWGARRGARARRAPPAGASAHEEGLRYVAHLAAIAPASSRPRASTPHNGAHHITHPALRDMGSLRGAPVPPSRPREREALQQREHAVPVDVPGVGAA